MRNDAGLRIFDVGYDRKGRAQKSLFHSEKNAIAVRVHYQHLDGEQCIKRV
jgi:hypothetical protein